MTSVMDEATVVPGEPPSDEQPTRRVPGRRLWVLCGSLLLVAGLGWGAVNVVELIAHDERIERATVSADGLARLDVSNDSGSVTVVGADTDEVAITAEVSEGLRETAFGHSVAGSALEVNGSCPVVGSMWCSVTYRIEAPADLDVSVDAVDDRVDLSGIDGDVTIDADNGAVELSGVSGTIDVDADNGRVVGTGLAAPVVEVDTDNGRIELVFTQPPDRVTANGDNGNIEIVLPKIEGGYDVTADTDDGEVDIALTNNPESPHKVNVETDNGSITVRTAQ